MLSNSDFSRILQKLGLAHDLNQYVSPELKELNNLTSEKLRWQTRIFTLEKLALKDLILALILAFRFILLSYNTVIY